MNTTENDWWPQELASVTQFYIAQHDEFGWDAKSDYPYTGTKWSHLFKSGPGSDCWQPIENHIENALTADLIAAAEHLGLLDYQYSVGASPGGIGADFWCCWFPILDGGLYVEFVQWQDEYTNQMLARQGTAIRGSSAFRLLLDELEISLPIRRLKSEKNLPCLSELRQQMDRQLDPDTAEGEALRATAERSLDTMKELFY